MILDENILDDDYPVYWDCLYVADGKVIRSDIQGTVRDLKRDLQAKEIRRCDIFGRIEAFASGASIITSLMCWPAVPIRMQTRACSRRRQIYCGLARKLWPSWLHGKRATTHRTSKCLSCFVGLSRKQRGDNMSLPSKLKVVSSVVPVGVIDYSLAIVSDDSIGWTVAHVKTHLLSNEEAYGVANLLAAAPELLEACIQARAALPDAWFAEKCDVPRELIELLDAAIAKAEDR